MGHKVTIDVGTANISRHKELRILIRWHGQPYRIVVADDNSVAIDELMQSRHIRAVDCNTGIGRELIGYALRRAICIGIDTAETDEDKNQVTLDFGEFRL